MFFLNFTHRRKGKGEGRGKGNAKFTRLKSQMASGLQSFFLLRARVIIKRSKGQGKGNAKFTRLKSQMGSGL